VILDAARAMRLGWTVRARHVVAIACVGLLILAGSAGAGEVQPAGRESGSVAPDPVAVEVPVPIATAAPPATSAPVPTVVTETAVAQEATPAPTPTAVAEETAAVEATPAPMPTAVAEPTPAAQATPTPTAMAAPLGAATAAEPATRARTVTVAAAAQATPPPEPAPPAPPAASGCATPVEPLEGVEGVTETPSVDGVCRVSAAACSILGTDGDDVLTGSPFDDILCGLGGNDRLEGGNGDDVLLGGEGDDVLVGGAGDDCMVGGPGDDEADNAEEDAAPEVEQSADIEPGIGLTWQYADGITFDSAGRCTGATSYSIAGGNIVLAPRPGLLKFAPRASAPTGAAPAALAVASTGSVGVRVGLPDGLLAVRDDMVRVRVFCSAVVPAELVLLDDSQRIARKRFTCASPETTVRVRLNKAGRKLVARDDRVQTRLLVLAGGRAVSRLVLLVSARG
jgi:RTX calcium-binding nonapeptide repeat (4 copies)